MDTGESWRVENLQINTAEIENLHYSLKGFSALPIKNIIRIGTNSTRAS
ncbi:MAG: hypothetical protein PHF82_06265 [Lutispora sp.]|nr:hypothetical protein [Lutispora sp.]